MAAWACAIACASAPQLARADVTLGIGGAPYVGNFQTVSGTAHGGGTPVPLIDLDATSGRFEFDAQSVPYTKTRFYGNFFDPSSSAASQTQATVRYYEPSRHLAFGVGYADVQTWTYGTEPATTLRLEATGLRMEVHDRIATSASSRLELTVGGMPEMRGTIAYDVGIPGAPLPVNRLEGGQFDAEVREKLATGKRFGLDFGARYVDDRLLFSGSNATAQRADALLPFLELRVKL